ncbi:hypothetical protein [Deinococcus radiophilus]|uniref:GNAT family N-acetyltransferase n=1 Tax=Deinococcus radiophilus TaxID=32062 RepID=A0A431VTF1_9DEIO|nr:hypothetical protein [Deinococcus radiophilus]RTR26487.1 hypothetical protein EJ104_08005 [Deinococcus radiophilus]UFA50600.1 hypothetical protein LMT64_01410 [Deinococcus radiophilus]
MSLPARVRVTCPPLPLSAALAQSAQKLLPGHPITDAQKVALAIAGGHVIGAALRCEGQADALAVAPGWRGKGVEVALTEKLAAS